MMDDAKKAVEFQKQNVEDHVNLMISNDVNKILDNIFNASGALNEQVNQLNQLDEEVQRIEKAFSNVANLKVLEDEDLENLLNKVIAEYTLQNRKLFDMSWTPSTTAIFQKEFIATVTQMITGLKYQCSVGRNDLSFNPFIPVSPPPPSLAFSFMISTSTADERNGVQYNQYNYGMSKDVQDVQKYASYTAQVGGTYLASVYGTAMLNGATTAAVSAQASTMTALAATGVAVAVVVVIAVVSYMSGARKRFKMMKKYHEAELYKFYNSLTSQDISSMYRERCQDITSNLDEALVRVTALANGGDDAEKEKQRYHQEKEHIKALTNDIQELVALSDKIIKMKENNASEEELKPLLEKEKSLEEKLDKKSLINMASHFIVESFGIKAESAFSNFKLDNVRKAFAERQKALTKLQRLIEMKRHTNLVVLESEKVAFKEYLTLRAEFLNILSDSFEYIWGKKNKNTTFAKVKIFNAKIESMSNKYLHVEEFRALKNSAKWLVQFFEREP